MAPDANMEKMKKNNSMKNKEKYENHLQTKFHKKRITLKDNQKAKKKQIKNKEGIHCTHLFGDALQGFHALRLGHQQLFLKEGKNK